MKLRRLTAIILVFVTLFSLSACSLAEEESFEIKIELLPILSLIDTADSGKMRVCSRSAMPNGRAILATAFTYEGKTYTAEEMSGAVPTVMQKLSATDNVQNVSLALNEVLTVYGAEMVHAVTNFTLPADDGSLPVQAELYIVSIQDCLIERWILSPASSLYETDEAAQAELESDLLTARNSIEKDSSLEGYVNGHISMLTGDLSLTPSTAATEAETLESKPYSDPDGYFTLNIPAEAIVLTPKSTDEEIAAVREAFLAAYPEGGSRCFDLLEDDIRKEGGTIIFTADYRGMVEVFREEHPEYLNLMTLTTLATGCTDVAKNLEKEYGEASLLTSYEMETISGLTHTRAVFNLKCSDISMNMAMLDCFTDNGILWETDVFATDDSLFDALYRLTIDSLQYADSSSAE